MTASKLPDDVIRQIDRRRRKKLRSMVRVLSLWSNWSQVADQHPGLTIHMKNLQRRREHHDPRPSRQNLSTDHVVLSRSLLVYHTDNLSRPEELSWKQLSCFITCQSLRMNSFIDSSGVIEQASLTLRATRHGTEERRETELTHGFTIRLHTLIEHLPFCFQPVFEGMAVHSAILLIQGIGPFRYARTKVLGMSIKLVSPGLLGVP
jgi:hypothetical protein